MPLYKYTSLDEKGRKKKGSMNALDEVDLKNILKKQDLFLVECKAAKAKKSNTFFAVSSKVKKTEVTNFCRQFAIMINAGVSITKSLETLKSQKFSPMLQNILAEIYEKVIQGMYLSDAFKDYPKVFPSYFCSMIYVGETSGKLGFVLKRVADYYENDNKIKAKTKSSMIYPMFLFFLIFGVTIFLMVFIIPQFEQMISELGGNVPVITQVVMNVSHFFQENVYAILGTLAGLVLVGFIFFKKTKAGRYVKDNIVLHTPILKRISLETITTRFASSFSILLASGMTVIDSMESLSKILENRVFEKKFAGAVEAVRQGKRISNSIEKLNLFPPMLVEMLKVGEETGTLPEVLDTVSKFYDDALKVTIQKSTALLEPIIIVTMGVIVGFVIMGVLLPMIELMKSI